MNQKVAAGSSPSVTLPKKAYVTPILEGLHVTPDSYIECAALEDSGYSGNSSVAHLMLLRCCLPVVVIWIA